MLNSKLLRLERTGIENSQWRLISNLNALDRHLLSGGYEIMTYRQVNHLSNTRDRQKSEPAQMKAYISLPTHKRLVFTLKGPQIPWSPVIQCYYYTENAETQGDGDDDDESQWQEHMSITSTRQINCWCWRLKRFSRG